VNLSLDLVVKSRAVTCTPDSRPIGEEDVLTRRDRLRPTEDGHGRLAPLPASDPSVHVADALAGLEHDEDELVGFGAAVLDMHDGDDVDRLVEALRRP
jgi:hypothetical protein